jgi:hypothetical protein
VLALYPSVITEEYEIHQSRITAGLFLVSLLVLNVPAQTGLSADEKKLTKSIKVKMIERIKSGLADDKLKWLSQRRKFQKRDYQLHDLMEWTHRPVCSVSDRLWALRLGFGYRTAPRV